MEIETFEIKTRAKKLYDITPHVFEDTGLRYYTVTVNEQTVAIIGNPDFIGGVHLLVPYDPFIHRSITLPYKFPVDVDISELEDIAEAIENHFL